MSLLFFLLPFIGFSSISSMALLLSFFSVSSFSISLYPFSLPFSSSLTFFSFMSSLPLLLSLMSLPPSFSPSLFSLSRTSISSLFSISPLLPMCSSSTSNSSPIPLITLWPVLYPLPCISSLSPTFSSSMLFFVTTPPSSSASSSFSVSSSISSSSSLPLPLFRRQIGRSSASPLISISCSSILMASTLITSLVHSLSHLHPVFLFSFNIPSTTHDIAFNFDSLSLFFASSSSFHVSPFISSSIQSFIINYTDLQSMSDTSCLRSLCLIAFPSSSYSSY
jgi:hypothetical protein